MKRKIFLLACVLGLLVATAAGAETEFNLVSVYNEDSATNLQEQENTYAGFNFYGAYLLPELQIASFDAEDYDTATEKDFLSSKDFKVSYSLVSEQTGLSIWGVRHTASGDVVVIGGVLPAAEEGYDYDFQILAKVVEVASADYEAAIDKTFEFDGDEIQVEICGSDEVFYTLTGEQIADNIVDFDDIDINTATKDYSVQVVAVKNRSGVYDGYIASGDYADDVDFKIDVPVWLTCEIASVDEAANEDYFGTFEDKPVTSIIVKFNNDYEGPLKDGTKGVVLVPFIGNTEDRELTYVISWDVEYSEPFKISGKKFMEFSLLTGNSSFDVTSFSGAKPVSYTAAPDISSNVALGVTSDDENITITATVPSTAKGGTYSTVLTFNDAKGQSDTLNVSVKVSEPAKREIVLSATKSSINLQPGSSDKTVITASGFISGDISWDVNFTSANLSVDITKSGDRAAVLTVSTDKDVTPGVRSIPVKATDTVNKLTTSINVIVTVTAPQNPDPVNPPPASPEDSTPTTTQPTNITNRINLTDNSGGTRSAMPLSSLKPGQTDTIKISLANSGITAKKWSLRINGVESDAVSISNLMVNTSATSWAQIISSSSTEATVKADPPSNLSTSSAVTIVVTDPSGDEYVADLGTVEASSSSSSSSSSNIGSSGGGCGIGFSSLALLTLAALIRKRNS